MEKRLVPVLHNVSSVQRVVDAARIAYSLGYETLVITKPYGGAAQSGVPEAMRIALRQGKRLVVLPDLGDAVELLRPDDVILVTRDYAEESLDPLSPPPLKGLTLLVVSGGEPEFSAQEARLGRRVYLEGAPGKIGATGELSIILYSYRRVGLG
ncbi:MAG: RecB-family nuclease [Desulfurococcales archaeon]|nr:RecB-family nuclease [Desulfurococcales archaeon]